MPTFNYRPGVQALQGRRIGIDSDPGATRPPVNPKPVDGGKPIAGPGTTDPPEPGLTPTGGGGQDAMATYLRKQERLRGWMAQDPRIGQRLALRQAQMGRREDGTTNYDANIYGSNYQGSTATPAYGLGNSYTLPQPPPPGLGTVPAPNGPNGPQASLQPGGTLRSPGPQLPPNFDPNKPRPFVLHGGAATGNKSGSDRSNTISFGRRF